MPDASSGSKNTAANIIRVSNRPNPGTTFERPNGNKWVMIPVLCGAERCKLQMIGHLSHIHNFCCWFIAISLRIENYTHRITLRNEIEVSRYCSWCLPRNRGIPYLKVSPRSQGMLYKYRDPHFVLIIKNPFPANLVFFFVLVYPILANPFSIFSPFPLALASQVLPHGARDAKGLFDCSKAICAKSADDKAISSLGSKMVKWLHLLSPCTWTYQVSETINKSY